MGADNTGGHASVRFAVTDLQDADRAGRGVVTANLGNPTSTATFGFPLVFPIVVFVVATAPASGVSADNRHRISRDRTDLHDPDRLIGAVTAA